MSEKPIIIKYKLERSDYNSLKTYYMYRRKSNRTKIMVLVLVVSLVLLVISEMAYAYAFPFFKPIGLIGFFIIALMYSWISIDTSKLEKEVKDLAIGTIDLSLDSSGLSALWPDLHLRKEFSWPEMKYAYESDFHFYLFADQHFAIIIPKLLLKDSQNNGVRSLLEKYIPFISDVSGYKYQV